MRPKITGQLEQDVSEIYERAGYGTPSELIRDAVRRRVSELKEEYDFSISEGSSPFNYEIRHHPQAELIMLDLEPKRESDLKMKYRTNVGNNYVELLTPSTTYRESDICDRFEDTDGIIEAKFTTEPQIRFKIDPNTQRPFIEIVQTTFETLSEAIGTDPPEKTGESKENQLEAAVKQYADPL